LGITSGLERRFDHGCNRPPGIQPQHLENALQSSGPPQTSAGSFDCIIAAFSRLTPLYRPWGKIPKAPACSGSASNRYGLGSSQILMKSLYLPLLLSACLAFGQQAPKPANQKPTDSKPENSKLQSAATENATDSTPHKTDKAAAYYHFTMANMYEVDMAVYWRSDLMY
jgi:hypothetical protein